MTCNKIRNFTCGLSALQAQILLLRGFTSEETLLYQKDIATQLKRPLSTINYNISVLRERGLWTKLNFLTPDGKTLFLKLKGYFEDTRKFRAHKIFGRFNLASEYKDFDSVRNKYLQISRSPKHSGFRINYNDCVVLFYSPTKICFYLPDVYGDSIEEIYAVAYEEYVKPLKDYLEKTFDNLKIDRHEICSVTLNHLAFRYHQLAKIFKEFNVQYASDRIEVDHSHGVPELETVHKETAVQDMDKILEYEKVVRGSDSCNLKGEQNDKT